MEQHYLSVGTEVSAKYRGAFCEAKIKSVKKVVIYKFGETESSNSASIKKTNVCKPDFWVVAPFGCHSTRQFHDQGCQKLKVSCKKDGKVYSVSDESLKGPSKVGSTVEVRLPDLPGWHEGIILTARDKSVYTVEFDDGDVRTLSRGSLCLQGVRHFAESDTLDHLPLTDPENFGTPVLNSKRKTKRKPTQSVDTEDGDSDDQKMPESEPNNKRKLAASKSESKPESDEAPSILDIRKKLLSNPLMGKLVLVEPPDKRKHWYPAVCVNPLCIDEDGENVSDRHVTVRSFKTGKVVKVLKCERLTKSNTPTKVDSVWKDCLDSAFSWEETGTIPDVWRMDIHSIHEDNDDEEGRTRSSKGKDTEEEEKNNDFLEQLYKFMEDRGSPISKTPVLGYKDLDLFLLFNLVHGKGGFHNITAPTDWREIYAELGIPKLTQAAGHHAKMAYTKYLLNFEEYMLSFEKRHRSKASRPRLDSAAKSARKLTKSKSFRTDDDPETATRRTSRRRKLSETTSVADENESSQPSKESKRTRKSKSDAELKRDSDVDDASSTTSSEKSLTRSKNSSEAKNTQKVGGRRRSNSGTASRKKQVIYKAGDKLQVKYGKDSFKLYNAKVVDVEVEGNEVQYYVHYAGWNNRHDEWIKPWRISSLISDKSDSPNSPTPSSKGASSRAATPTVDAEKSGSEILLPTTPKLKQEDLKGTALDFNDPPPKDNSESDKKDVSSIIKDFQEEEKKGKQTIKERIRRRSTSSSTPPPAQANTPSDKRAASVEKFLSNKTKKETKVVLSEEKSPTTNNQPSVPIGLFPAHRRTSGRRSKSPAYLKDAALYGLTKRKRNSNSISSEAAVANDAQDVDDLSSETSSPSVGSSPTEANRASPLTVWSETDKYIEKNMKPDRKRSQRKAAERKLLQIKEKAKVNTNSSSKKETYDSFDDEAPNIELEKGKSKKVSKKTKSSNETPDTKSGDPDPKSEHCPPKSDPLSEAEQKDADKASEETTKKENSEEEKGDDTSSSSNENSSYSNNNEETSSSSTAPVSTSNQSGPSELPNQVPNGQTSSSKALLENTPPTTPETSPEHFFEDVQNNGGSTTSCSSGPEAIPPQSPDKHSHEDQSEQEDKENKSSPKKRKLSRSRQSPHRKTANNEEENERASPKHDGESDSEEEVPASKPPKRKKPKKKKRDIPTAPAMIPKEELAIMTPDQKIKALQDKMTEMRNVYQQLKQEVSSIDRKRKRAKRREQEAAEISAKKNSASSPTKSSSVGLENELAPSENISVDVDPVSV